MQQRIREIAADVFGVSVDELPDDASTETVPGWDSLHHLELMLALELELGARLTSETMAELLSLEDIEAHLRAQQVGADLA